MNLYISTYIFAILFLFVGIAFGFRSEQIRTKAFEFLRSKTAAYILFGGSAIYFVYILSQLGESDFGNIKHWLILIFGGASLLAFKFLPDFLSVRGLAAALLLFSRFAIDSAFMQEPQSRLVMVSVAYIVVVASLYFGALPYRMRDMFEYLYERPIRTKVFGIAMLLCSIALVLSTIFY